MSDKAPTPQEDSLRSWYTRKTRTAFRALIGATLITITAAVLLWVMADLPFLSRMQTFNGAIVIPAAGGIWIASFMYIWLIPMRELSFRGQESLDRTEERMKQALEEKLLPAAEVWTRIGKRVEEELLPRVEKVVKEAELRMGPTAESVRRLENTAEGKLGLLVTDVRAAADSVKKFFGPQGKPADLNGAFDFMTKPTNGTPTVERRK